MSLLHVSMGELILHSNASFIYKQPTATDTGVVFYGHSIT